MWTIIDLIVGVLNSVCFNILNWFTSVDMILDTQQKQ